MNLNGSEEDRKAFKEKVIAERELGDIEFQEGNSEIFSDHTSIYSKSRAVEQRRT